MKIELTPDRAVRRPDPVEAASGVFAHTAPEELSEAETKRFAKAVPEDAGAPIPNEIPVTPPPATAPKTWSPKAVLKRVTDLYSRFSKPKGQS